MLVMKKIRFLSCYFLFAIPIFLSSCVDEPHFPEKPHIEFDRLSRDLIDQRDTFRIFVTIEDGDGDIGFEDQPISQCDNPCDLTSDSSCLNYNTLFLLDSRDNCLHLFNLPHVEPKGQNNAISGTVDILVEELCCFDPEAGFCPTSIPFDTVTFDVFLKDRAGNFSDTITTPPVVIRCI